jgi:nucleoside-diphosphate-sugar epimerase
MAPQDSDLRIVVTGNLGYVGSVLTPRLLALGHDVLGLDVGLFKDCTLGPAPDDGGRYLDVRDVTPADLDGADVVIHLAALSNDPLGDIDPELTTRINTDATVRLAEAAKRAGVRRFLFSSSCSIYGAAKPGRLLDERSELNPLSWYADSKLRAEDALGSLADETFSPVFLRSGTAYGYSPRVRTDLVINDLTAQAVLTGEITVRSDGTAWRPFVHVEDISAAFVALLRVPREVAHARAFNVGQTAENYQIRDVARIVAEAVPGSRMTIAGTANPDSRDYRVSCERIKTEVPAFRAGWSVRRGIEQLVREYRRFGIRREDAEGPRFQRLKLIQALQNTGRLDGQLRVAC